MIRFLRVNDIGVVSIDKIEAFNAVVRVGKLKKGMLWIENLLSSGKKISMK